MNIIGSRSKILRTPIFFILFLSTPMLYVGCESTTSNEIILSDEENLLLEGKEFLSQGHFKPARSNFIALDDVEDHKCDAQFGLTLADMLEIASRFDAILETISSILEAAPGLAPQQGSLNTIIGAFFSPFEQLFDRIRERGRFITENRCVFNLDGGFPVDLGKEGDILFIKLVVGYEWDYASIRVVILFVDLLQAIADFLLGHDLSLEDIKATVDVVTAAFDNIDTVRPNGQLNTYIDAARAFGILLYANPEFFDTADKTRINNIDNVVAEMMTTMFHRDGAHNRGMVPDMFHRQLQDPDPRDNVLGWIDNGDGKPGGDDSMMLGIRGVNLFSTVQLSAITEGIELFLSSEFGDIESAIDGFHEIWEVVGNQMLAVDDPSIKHERLGFEPVNKIVESIDLVALFLPTFPLALEFDFGSLFSGIDGNGLIPLRDMAPYWYDDDGCVPIPLSAADDDCRADVFVIEGESAITNAGEFVFPGDVTHFPNSFTFGTYGAADNEDEEILLVTNTTIPADGVSPSTFFLVSPIPYIMWQEPNFNGAIWVDLSLLPLAAEGEEGFELATQYSVNKIITAYIEHFITESRFELSEFLNQEE